MIEMQSPNRNAKRMRRRTVLALVIAAVLLFTPWPNKERSYVSSSSSSFSSSGEFRCVVATTKHGLGWPIKTLFYHTTTIKFDHRRNETSTRHEFDSSELQKLGDEAFENKYGIEKSRFNFSHSVPQHSKWQFNPGPVLLILPMCFLVFVAIPHAFDWRRKQEQRLIGVCAARGYARWKLVAEADRVTESVVKQGRGRVIIALLAAITPMLLPSPSNPGRCSIGGFVPIEPTSASDTIHCNINTRDVGVGWPWKTVYRTTLLVTCQQGLGATSRSFSFNYDEFQNLDDASFKAKFGVGKTNRFFGNLIDETGWYFNFWPILLFAPLSYLCVAKLPLAFQRWRVWWRVVEGRCVECAYDLQGSTGDRCPECGWEIKQAGLSSAATREVLVKHAK